MFLTIAEAATRLRLSQDTVRRMVKDGELVAFKGPANNSPYRISAESVQSWITAHTIRPGVMICRTVEEVIAAAAAEAEEQPPLAQETADLIAAILAAAPAPVAQAGAA